MKILQAGYPKSGNYWLYKILSGIKTEAGIKPISYIKTDPIYPLAKGWELNSKEQVDTDMIDILPQGCFYRISSRYRNKIDDLSLYVEKTNHVWTNSHFCSMSSEVIQHFDKVVYIIRDPRDVAVASAKFAFTPYMIKHYPTWHNDLEDYLEKELPEICKSWTKHVLDYLGSEMNIYFIFYERLLFDFDNELNALLEFLQLSLTIEEKKSIKKHVALNMLNDSNPYHQKPKLYGWKNRFTSFQRSSCLDYAKPLLQYLNYPIKVEDDNLPGFMSDIKQDLIINIKRQLERKSFNQRFRIVQDAFK